METYLKTDLENVISIVQTDEIVINGEGTVERLDLCLEFITYPPDQWP